MFRWSLCLYKRTRIEVFWGIPTHMTLHIYGHLEHRELPEFRRFLLFYSLMSYEKWDLFFCKILDIVYSGKECLNLCSAALNKIELEQMYLPPRSPMGGVMEGTTDIHPLLDSVGSHTPAFSKAFPGQCSNARIPPGWLRSRVSQSDFKQGGCGHPEWGKFWAFGSKPLFPLLEMNPIQFGNHIVQEKIKQQVSASLWSL